MYTVSQPDTSKFRNTKQGSKPRNFKNSKMYIEKLYDRNDGQYMKTPHWQHLKSGSNSVLLYGETVALPAVPFCCPSTTPPISKQAVGLEQSNSAAHIESVTAGYWQVLFVCNASNIIHYIAVNSQYSDGGNWIVFFSEGKCVWAIFHIVKLCVSVLAPNTANSGAGLRYYNWNAVWSQILALLQVLAWYQSCDVVTSVAEMT